MSSFSKPSHSKSTLYSRTTLTKKKYIIISKIHLAWHTRTFLVKATCVVVSTLCKEMSQVKNTKKKKKKKKTARRDVSAWRPKFVIETMTDSPCSVDSRVKKKKRRELSRTLAIDYGRDVEKTREWGAKMSRHLLPPCQWKLLIPSKVLNHIPRCCTPDCQGREGEG